MLLNANLGPHGGNPCLLSCNEAERWLQGTWAGYVDEDEAMRGAAAYLHHAAQRPCPLLLDANTALRGPWFDGLDWLAHLPAPAPFGQQVLQNLAAGGHWLRACRDASARPRPGAPAPAGAPRSAWRRTGLAGRRSSGPRPAVRGKLSEAGPFTSKQKAGFATAVRGAGQARGGRAKPASE